MSFTERYLNRHILFEIAPGIIFYVVNSGWGLRWATGAVIVSAVVFTALGVIIEKRMPVFPMITVFFILVLGGATLIFDNEVFIKVKPTVAKLLFVAILGSGLLLDRSILMRALEGQVYLTDKGWRILTFRWIALAILLAIANEIIWRTQDTDTWVAFTALLGPLSILGYILITRFTAPSYWQEPEQEFSS